MSDTEDVNIADSMISHVTPSCLIYQFVRYQLRDANDYMNVSYIHNNHECGGRMECGLCQTVLWDGPWSGDDVQREVLEKHVQTLRHETRFLQLKHLQKRHVRFLRNKRLHRSGKLRKRLSRLGFTKWKWHVNHLVMEYIDAPLPESPTCLPTPEEELWNKAATQLAVYEQKERMSLLELAIKKYDTYSMQSSMNKMVKEEDEQKDPKEVLMQLQEERRVKNGASIVIPLVLEFLGEPMPLPLL